MKEFPHKDIEQYLIKKMTTIELLPLSLKKIEGKYSNAHNDDYDKISWIYRFHYLGSPIDAEVTFTINNISFFSHLSLIENSHKSILLSDYLEHIGNKEIDEFLAKYFYGVDKSVPENQKQYFMNFIDLAVKFLKTDLAKVAKGEEWIHIPFDRYGY